MSLELRRRMLKAQHNTPANVIFHLSDEANTVFKITSVGDYLYNYISNDGYLIKSYSESGASIKINAKPNTKIKIYGEITGLQLGSVSVQNRSNIKIVDVRNVKSLNTFVASRDISLEEVIGFEDAYLPTSTQQDAFRECGNLTKIKLPLGLKVISNNTFRSCLKLTLEELPSLTSIGQFGISSTISDVYLPDTITSLGQNACLDSLIRLTSFPQNLKLGSIAMSALKECRNLIISEFPNSWTGGINHFAFQNCRNLTIKELPSGISSIGKQSLLGTGITELKILRTTSIVQLSMQSADAYPAKYFSDGVIIKVPNSLLESYLADEVWKYQIENYGLTVEGCE